MTHDCTSLLSQQLACLIFVCSLLVYPGCSPELEFKFVGDSPSIERADEPLNDDTSPIKLSFFSRYVSGVYKQSGAEIVVFEPVTKRAFVVNAFSGKVDVLDLADIAKPNLLFSIDVSDLGAAANSVSVSNGMVAIAVEATNRTENGFVAFYDTDGIRKSVVEVGALPDAVTFSPDGKWVLVANEGEPNADYTIDPEGSVSIIDVSQGIDQLTAAHVRTADFRQFNGKEDELRAQGIRIFGPNASAAQDFEPEWVEVTSDSSRAYVSLQENNAVAEIDIASATVTRVMPLGFKDWSSGAKWAGRGFDASDKDNRINIRNWPVYGMFQPDTIKLYEVDGKTYIITANEGDARAYDGFSEEASVADLQLDRSVFPDAEELQLPENLGRLLVTRTEGGFVVNAGPNEGEHLVYRELYSFGARSMSIWMVAETGLELVYDTGSQIEETTAAMYPEFFNADHQDSPTQFDKRSRSKGPEPEGLAVGSIGGRTYAFLGLERIGGGMVYDITEPAKTKFLQYLNSRDFSIATDPTAAHTQTDLGAEGLFFVGAADSPDSQGRPLLLVGNEVSGTTAIYLIEVSGQE
ncbi:MAG TPA: choice-of-anchor I family protein [Pirellulaceae bacterium]|nr:choice-of-anchor I family protein [Pirellulaceae bacterium]